MAQIRIKAGTRAQLDAAALANGLAAREPYFITDESRFAVGTAANAYQVMVKEGDGVPPSGGAGGVLSGSYPNPSFAVDMATQAELDAVNAAKVDKVAGKGLSAEDYSSAEKTKLAGIATGATANATDAQLRDRATHTGAQAISTVTGLQGALDAKLAGTNPSVTGTITEDVYAIVDAAGVAVAPANGSIQTWTLGANRTPNLAGIASGQAVTLEITAGAYTITWTGVTWVKVGGSGTAPTLSTTGVSTVVLWKVGSTLKGCYPGST